MNRYAKIGKRNPMLPSVVLLFLFTIAIFVSACEPGGWPTIDNQTNQDLTILVITVRENEFSGQIRNYGVVPARTTKRLASITFVRREWVYRIQAEDPSGKVVFSQDYNMDDLEKIKWKIVIPP